MEISGIFISPTRRWLFVHRKELWADAKYGVINQAPKALARSIRYTKEIVSL